MTSAILKSIGAWLAALTIGVALAATPADAAPRHGGQGGGHHFAAHRGGGGHFAAHRGGGRHFAFAHRRGWHGGYYGGGYYGGGYYDDCSYEPFYGRVCGADPGPAIVGGIIGGALNAIDRGY